MPKWMLALCEVTGVALVAVGVAMWSVPAALVLLGVVAVVACEVRGGRTLPAKRGNA